MLPPGWEFWLDGGHNPAAGEVLADVAAGWRDRPLYLVVGMLNTKDAAGFLAPARAACAHALRAVTIPGEENPLPADEIAAAARSVGIAAREARSVDAALRDIVAAARAGARADLRLAAFRRRRPGRERLIPRCHSGWRATQQPVNTSASGIWIPGSRLSGAPE